MLRLRRHVVFVVFGQNFGGLECLALLHFPLSHHAFAFFEQIGQETGVRHGDFVCKVSHDKLHVFTVFLHTAFFDHAAHAKGPALRGLPLRDLGGGEKENQVALECIQNQRARCGLCQ